MAQSFEDWILNGDHKVFSAVYDEYWKKVLRFARLYISDPYEQE